MSADDPRFRDVHVDRPVRASPSRRPRPRGAGRPRRRFRRVGRLGVLIVLVGVAWRVGRYAACFPLWGDEAFTAMNVVLRDARGLADAPLEYDQAAPLGFLYAELAAAAALGVSEYALRLIPLLAGVAALVAFWRFAGGSLDRRSALLAAAALAAAFYPVRHGAEVKPYTLDLLVATGLLALGWRVMRRGRARWSWASLAAVAAVGVWFSFPAVFVVAGVCMCLAGAMVRERAWKRLAALAGVALAAGMSFAAAYVVFIGPQFRALESGFVGWYWREAYPPVAEPWRLPWWLLKVHTGNMLAYPYGGKNFASTLTLVMVIVGAVSLWRRGRRGLVLLVLSPLPATFVAAAMQRYPYGTSARIALHVAPAFCLLGGAGLAATIRRLLPRRRAGAGVRLAAIGMAVGAVVVLALDVARPYKTLASRQNRRAVRAITSRVAGGDHVIVANSPGPSRHAPRLAGACSAPFRYYLTRLSPVPVRWAPPAERVEPPRGRTWLLYFTEYKNVPHPRHRARRFGRYLDALVARLGRPDHIIYELDHDDPRYPPPAIEVYLFAPGGVR
jgi:hypothetical protein